MVVVYGASKQETCVLYVYLMGQEGSYLKYLFEREKRSTKFSAFWGHQLFWNNKSHQLWMINLQVREKNLFNLIYWFQAPILKNGEYEVQYECEECFIPLQNYLRSGVPTGGLDFTSSDINTIQGGGVRLIF